EQLIDRVRIPRSRSIEERLRVRGVRPEVRHIEKPGTLGSGEIGDAKRAARDRPPARTAQRRTAANDEGRLEPRGEPTRSPTRKSAARWPGRRADRGRDRRPRMTHSLLVSGVRSTILPQGVSLRALRRPLVVETRSLRGWFDPRASVRGGDNRASAESSGQRILDPSLGSRRGKAVLDHDLIDPGDCGCDDDSEKRQRLMQALSFEPAPIPRSLHSAYEGAPFRECSVCARLLRFAGLYEIQKTWHGGECVFEMALCLECSEKLAKEFSAESLAAIKGYLLCRFQPSKDADRCNFCQTPRESLRCLTLLGVCRGAAADLLQADACSPDGELDELEPCSDADREVERSMAEPDQLILPIVIMCEPCALGLQESLSAKTREIQSDFLRDHFPGIPTNLDFRPTFGGCF